MNGDPRASVKITSCRSSKKKVSISLLTTSTLYWIVQLMGLAGISMKHGRSNNTPFSAGE